MKNSPRQGFLSAPDEDHVVVVVVVAGVSVIAVIGWAALHVAAAILISALAGWQII